jgi:alcohol dehydrogenase (cytochrome c)
MPVLRGRPALLPIVLATAALAGLAGDSTSANVPAVAPGDWPAFGRTVDNNRYSPLTEITPQNVAQLGRAYTKDFLVIDPDTIRGQQSYPLAIGGTLYVTTNDANVFAIDGATGKILWQHKPQNSAVFKNFGVRANRGLAYCGGKLFILQLDMKLVAINPSDGSVAGELAISQDVPDATVGYGYSETSAPVCVNNTIVFGAAGSERGPRGFVMAYTPDLKPAWPTPFWTIPPDRQSWRRASRIIGGGPVWTPVTIDAKTNTVYFGTGSGTPVYFPSLRPGNDPRSASLIAVDLSTGKLKWWQQLIQNDQWEYDVAQPPLVYDGKVGGKATRIVSVATKEGMWYAFDAKTGKAFHDRVKVLDRVEHPPLKAGQPVVVYPGSIGGLNYSPAAYDPKLNYVYNAAAETAGVLIQKKLTPTQKKRKFLLGDIFLGLDNGNFGDYLPGWKDHGSISAIDVSTGRRVWKFDTPEPERGGVSLTLTGVGFAGGGDGVLRAFDSKTGKVLWTFQTGRQIAAGPTIFSAGGKEFVAITVGGTPTSSAGGLASQLQVFALGGSSAQSPKPPGLTSVSGGSSTTLAKSPAATRSLSAHVRTAAVGARVAVPAGAITLGLWNPNSSNLVEVKGKILLGGKPVSGASVSVDRYTLPQKTAADGSFTALVDSTLTRRHPIVVIAGDTARVGGRPLTAAEAATLKNASGGINVGYKLDDLKAVKQSNGTVKVTGRAVRSDGVPVPPVVLLSYRLSGTISDSLGKPVQGAYVVSRTNDRDYWTFSEPTNAAGRYVSFFPASDLTEADPVEFSIQVAIGRTSYTTGLRNPTFKRRSSAEMDLKLPASGTTMAVPTSAPQAGAIYRGTLIGVSAGKGVVHPVSATWPDTKGRFELVLPSSVRGKVLRFWQSDFQTYQTTVATPGGEVDLKAWPTALSPRVPRDTAFLRAPDPAP